MEWSRHLLVLPILLPLVTGAALLLVDETRRTLKALVNFASTLLLLFVTLALMRIADTAPAEGAALSWSYAVSGWPAPFAIVLVLDRLAALMLVLTSVLALASLTFSMARWHRAGPHFHTLFQFLLMGLGGAFLTGDLFNLFVFFEVVLAASYGLLLHGGGVFRVRSGMHYIAINLAASLLFLVGVSLIYGVAGTLNMADLALRLPSVATEDRALLQAGAAILGVAFLVKAGMWPLCFWLPPAYMAAAAPVAAIFAVLSKVGVYVILRLSLLIFGSAAGELTGFGGSWLLAGGLATIAFGSIGVLASQAMGRLAGFYVLVSSGTMLAAIGMESAGVTAGALYYMVSSTLAISAFFLLVELVERAQDPAANVLAVTMEAYGDDMDEEEAEEEVGVAIPATLAVLGICFACCAILLAGIPPLSGFVGKFALLTAMIGPAGQVAPVEGVVPRVLVMDIAPVAFLILLCLALTVEGGPAMRYMNATAQSLHQPSAYISDVLSARPVPNPESGAHK
jgi:multicomponent K+:H+ antiporter subunit D